jgi:hypothetical protein
LQDDPVFITTFSSSTQFGVALFDYHIFAIILVVIIALTEVLMEQFLQKLYFRFLEILTSKQMVQVSLFSF